MNTRKNIELTRKLFRIRKHANRNSSSIRKFFKNFLMDNWKASVSTLFILCSITIPFSYLHHINSAYLLHDALLSVKAWIGAFILLATMLFFVLVIPLFAGTGYFFILKSKNQYIKDENILIKLNNLLNLTPTVAIILIATAYIFDYSSPQIKTIIIMMILAPSILCLFYSLKEIKTNCKLLLYIVIFSIMIYLALLNIPSKTTQIPSNIFIIFLIVFFSYMCMLLLIPRHPIEEKTTQEIIKSNFFKSTLLIALVLLIINIFFIIFYFFLILSILPKEEMLSYNFDDSVRNINQLIYSIILIIIYISSNSRHNSLINNKEKLNPKAYLKEKFFAILSAFFTLLLVVNFMPSYPIFIINSMRTLGYIEDQRDSKWYSIDNRFIEWNNFHVSFLDKKMLYTPKQICSKKDFDLIKLTKQEKGKIPFHLYGYMAWNTGSIRVFCPVSIPIGKDVGSKCWHIPSQYINLLPE